MKNGLYEIFAEKYYHGGTVYFYSDPHFGDLESYKFRINNLINAGNMDNSFVRIANKWHIDNLNEVIDSLDQIQIDNINKVCGKNDTLIILGDVGNIECVKKLKAGYKVLILGNHDKGASNYKRIVEETDDINSTPACLYMHFPFFQSILRLKYR